jgi:hypothetical protein
MYKIMQKYNKKLLAIVMVFLMIAFIIPQFSRQRNASEFTIGQVGDQKINKQEVDRARYYWAILKGGDTRGKDPIPGVVIQDMDRQTGQPTLKSLAELFGPQAVNEIERHPVMFVLLQHEATKNGITVADRDIDAFLAEVQVRLPDRNVLYENVKDQEIGDNVREAVRDFMLINASFDQSLSMIKVSQPLLASRMAKELQEIKLQLVEFDDKNYNDKVPAPTPEQIQEQFNKYADVLPGEGDSKTNLFGFGYKYPDRIKLAYIGISRDEVKKSIRASKSEYDWDVEAQKYYKKNASLFPSTQPATTQASDALNIGSSPKPTTKPTTKPFEDVRDSILEALITPEAQKLETTILSHLTTQMREDWNAYHTATKDSPTTQPANAPNSSVGVRFDSPEYLNKLAEQFQNQFKVVPTVVTLNEKFLSQQDLRDLPAIGKAAAMFNQQFLPFNIYATALAEPFTKGKPDTGLQPILLFEPSRPVEDFSGATFIFRITAADPAHKPADSRDLLQKIEDDLRTQAAYELAKADASKLLGAAKAASLRAAATSASKSVTDSGYIRAEGQLPSDLPVSSLSQQTFVDEAFKLLSNAAKNEPTITVIGLPRDYKIFVAQLADVRRIPMFAGQVLEPQLARQIMGELGRDMYQQWYRYDSVTERMHYVDANKKKDSEG